MLTAYGQKPWYVLPETLPSRICNVAKQQYPYVYASSGLHAGLELALRLTVDCVSLSLHMRAGVYIVMAVQWPVYQH